MSIQREHRSGRRLGPVPSRGVSAGRSGCRTTQLPPKDKLLPKLRHKIGAKASQFSRTGLGDREGEGDGGGGGAVNEQGWS